MFYRSDRPIDNPLWRAIIAACPLLLLALDIPRTAAIAMAAAGVLIASSVATYALRGVATHVRLPALALVVGACATTGILLTQAFLYDAFTNGPAFAAFIVVAGLNVVSVQHSAATSIGRTLLDSMIVGLVCAAMLIAFGALRESVRPVLPVGASTAGAFLLAGLLLAAINAAVRKT